MQWEELQYQIAPCFGRIELRRRARSYLEGLLAPLERKNGGHLAEAAEDASPDGVQDFLARTRWDADTLRDVLRSYVIEHLADPNGVLVIDETGFLKKGDKSAGVQRQCSGTARRIENCQVGVFLGYAAARGYAFIDRALYLPSDWVADEARCAQAHIPACIGFATKPELARQMLKRAFDAGVPCAWVAGDSVYGAVSELRALVAEHGRGYLLGVTSAQQLHWPHYRTVAEIANDFPQRAWQRLSCGPGAKGPSVQQWIYQVYGSTEDGWCKGLLVRRHPKRRNERAYYLTCAPVGTSLETLVKIAGRRWTIESGFEQAKGEVGSDQYEVRRFDGWLRHITLALLAHAFLAAIRARSAGGRTSARALAHALAAHRARGTPALLQLVRSLAFSAPAG